MRLIATAIFWLCMAFVVAVLINAAAVVFFMLNGWKPDLLVNIPYVIGHLIVALVAFKFGITVRNKWR